MAWRMMRTPPKADNATAMVMIAENVISRLRRRLVPVSRATYPAEIGIRGYAPIP